MRLIREALYEFFVLPWLPAPKGHRYIDGIMRGDWTYLAMYIGECLSLLTIAGMLFVHWALIFAFAAEIGVMFWLDSKRIKRSG